MPNMQNSRKLLLAAGLVLLAGLCQACVSVNPWRACKAPCQDAQFQQARAVEICKTDGVPLLLVHPKWGHDERGDYLSGPAKTRLGQSLGEVKVYRDEMDRVYTQTVEGGRVAANAALVPLVLVLSAVSHEDVSSQDEDSPTHDIWQTELEACPPPRTSTAPPSR